MKSLKLPILLELLKKVDKHNAKVTRKSLNHVPEYYINVLLGEQIHKLGYRIEFEMHTDNVIKALNISESTLNQAMSQGVDLRSGRVDLVVKTPELESFKHIIEIKRGAKAGGLEKDIRRINYFSDTANKRSVQRGFIVFVTGTTPDTVVKKLTELEQKIGSSIEGDYFQSILNNNKEYTNNTDNTPFTKDTPIYVWCCEVR